MGIDLQSLTEQEATWLRPLAWREVLEKIGGFVDVPAPDTYIQDQVMRLGIGACW